MHAFAFVAFLGLTAAKPGALPLPPFLSEMSDMIGIAVTQPKQATNRLPFLNFGQNLFTRPWGTDQTPSVDTELEGQQYPLQQELPYQVTPSGQYASVEDFAAALTREGGVPPALANSIAENTRVLQLQMSQTVRSMASFLDVLNEATPRVGALAQPMLRGMQAAGAAVPQPIVNALTDLFVQLGELAASTANVVTEAPALAFLTLPAEELAQGATTTINAISPLDPSAVLMGYAVPNTQNKEYEAEEYENEPAEE